MKRGGRKKNRCRGQVLLVAVAVIVILVVVALFLFDLRGVVRLRTQAQTAGDAAVLAAAGWQGRSLNMIGEMNLIKAATVLISDIPPYGDDSATGLLDSAEVLSQMQTRLSYAGPLLGFSAAQQAAKNNGLRSASVYTDSIWFHINQFLSSGHYASIYPNAVHGYEWLEPYEAMLSQIATDGIAARPVSSRLLAGMPRLIGPGAFLLMDREFYAAVHTRNYCWFYRHGVEPTDQFNFDQIVFDANESPFFMGSEFCNLFVSLATATPGDAPTPFLDDRGQTRLPDDQAGIDALEWAVYEGNGGGYGWDSVGLYDFVTPYLRSDIKSEYRYSGACIRMMCTARPALLTGLWAWKYGETEDSTPATQLGNELSWSDEDLGDGSFREHGRRLNAAEQRLKREREGESVDAVSAAKPFGMLEAAENLPPQSVGIVLPVFSDVRLIPAALVRENTVERDPTFQRFLIDYFGDPNYPNVPASIRQQYIYYVSAMETFSDMSSSFRTGWQSFDQWRQNYMDGPDGIPGNADDQPDPCTPVFGGGGGGGGSIGGPGIIH